MVLSLMSWSASLLFYAYCCYCEKNWNFWVVGFRSSEGCHFLELVNISWCSEVTDDGLELLSLGCSGLQFLFCKGCHKVCKLIPHRV